MFPVYFITVTKNNITTSGGSFNIVATLAILIGLVIFSYGLLLVPVSVLGGVWIAAIGLSLLFAGIFATEWIGNRLGLSTANQRMLSLAFAVLAMFLLASFLVVNFMSFEFGEMSSIN